MPGPGNAINEATTGISGFTGTAFTGSPATQHTVQIGGATTSSLVSVTNGTTGQFLGANTGAAPTWQTPTPGALILLGSFDLSGLSQQAFVSMMSSTYRNYLLKVCNLYMSGNNRPTMVVSQDNGSSYLNSNYDFFYGTMFGGSGFVSAGGTGQTAFYLGNNMAQSNNQPEANFDIYFFSGLGSNSFTYHGQGMHLDTVSGLAYNLPWGFMDNLSPEINAIKLVAESGTFQTGFASLYGFAK